MKWWTAQRMCRNKNRYKNRTANFEKNCEKNTIHCTVLKVDFLKVKVALLKAALNFCYHFCPERKILNIDTKGFSGKNSR